MKNQIYEYVYNSIKKNNNFQTSIIIYDNIYLIREYYEIYIFIY